MRIGNSRHAWLCRGITGVGLAAPLALAPALPVTVHPEARMAESDRAVDVGDVGPDVAPPPRTQR